MNGKSEKIEDLKEAAKIRWQAMKVIVKGNLVAIAMTALVMLIP